MRTATRAMLTTIARITALTAVVPAMAAGQATGTYTVSGDRVAIYNLAGTVEVRGGSGSTVAVDVRAGGADAGELRVETGPIRGEETLRVIYPDDRIIYEDLHRRSRTEIRVREDGTFFNDRGRRWGDRVTITGSGRGLEAYADMTITVPVNGRVSVYLGVGEVSVSNVTGDLVIDVASASVSATNHRGPLLIDTGSGSVDVTGVEGDLNVDTGSGSVEVNDVTGSRLLVDTGSGAVRGGGITVQDLNVDTGSGSITLSDVTARDAVLDTGSGSVRVELLRDIDNLEIDTGSGAVTVYFPEDLGAQLDLESSSGGIDFDVPVTVRRFDRSSLQGVIGDGRGRISVDTGSGSIRFIKR